MGALNTTVHVPDDNGGYTVFGPGDEIPAELLDRVGAHCFEDGEHPSDAKPARKTPAKAASKSE